MQTILLTCVGGELAPQMIGQLRTSTRHPGLRVVGVDGRADAVGRHMVDVFSQVPLGNAPGYIEAILEIVEKNRIELLIPTSDEEAVTLASERDRLQAAGCTLACAESTTLQQLTDKSKTYQRMAQLGLPVPEWQYASTKDQLVSVVQSMIAAHGDVVVKPVVERGSRGVCVITTRNAQGDSRARERHMSLPHFLDETLPGYGAHLPAMVMPRLLEPVHDLDMLAWNGRAIRIIPRRRVSSSLPNEGHIIKNMPALIELGEKLIAGFNLSWLYDCDIMFDSEGTPWVLEINPRQSGSVAATVAAGVPLLDDLVSLAKGDEPPAIEIPWDTVVVPFKSVAVSRLGNPQ
jgi:carbamoylphosphate synthase large subunit